MPDSIIRKRADCLATGDVIAFDPGQSVTVTHVTITGAADQLCSVHYTDGDGSERSRDVQRAARYVVTRA